MAHKQTGVAVVFGFPGAVAWAGIGTLFNESGDFEHAYKLDQVEDEDNEVRTLIHSGETYEATLQFTPRAAVGANTVANAALSLAPPAKGSTVTLGGSPNFALAIANSSQWVYVGGWRVSFRKAGVASYELKIKRSPNYDLSAAVT